jgi:alkanesulfonate monooxygenase SsuD/methylene tetrahydromethanopterin reductase-like flavin-dependent oxidoreductase (luciferase family)
VRVGLFLDVRNPGPWAVPGAERYARTLELCQHADAAGIDGLWCTEHHFFEDGYLPQPLVMAAAIAARTRRARVGTAVLLAPLRQALPVAEEAAVVDLISGGRLELGLGPGYVAEEHERFGSDATTARARTEALLVEVRRLHDEGGVTPGPVQRPVPMWLGYQGPRGARRAGELGVGLLSLRPDLLEPYLAGWAAGGHPASGARMGGLVELVVAADPEQAAARIAPHRAHQQATYRAAAAGVRRGSAERPPSTDPRAGLAVVTPDDAVRVLRQRTAGLPVDHVYVWASVAGMPEDLVAAHVDLLCSRVLPELRGGPAGGS